MARNNHSDSLDLGLKQWVSGSRVKAEEGQQVPAAAPAWSRQVERDNQAELGLTSQNFGWKLPRKSCLISQSKQQWKTFSRGSLPPLGTGIWNKRCDSFCWFTVSAGYRRSLHTSPRIAALLLACTGQTKRNFQLDLPCFFAHSTPTCFSSIRHKQT